MRFSYHYFLCAIAITVAADKAYAMDSFLDRWKERYGQYTALGESGARCQICHVSASGGSTNGWNAYGWKVYELLESRKPFDPSDLDYAFDFAGLANSDHDQSDSSNLTEIQGGYFPGWSLGNVNNHFLGSPPSSFSIVQNQAPPVDLSAELLDPPAKVSNPSGQSVTGTVGGVELRSRLTGLSWPRRLVVDPAQPDVLLVVNLDGKITRLDTRNNESADFVDLGAELSQSLLLATDDSNGLTELGLLNLVFAPDYASSKRFYTFHTELLSAQAVDFTTMPMGIDAHHNSVVTEWQVLSQSGHTVTSLSSRTLLRVAHPQSNNNGGGLYFDTKNTLLIGLGDGGGDGDQDQTIEFNGSVVPRVRGHGSGNASDLSNPLGSILRILPNGTGSANGEYGIPIDNPFVGIIGQVEEIFAYGFRNPSQISPAGDGALLVFDPGEVAIDEINRLSAGQFYGWNQSEGDYTYSLNGLDASYLSSKDQLTNNEYAPFTALGRKLGQGFVFEHWSADKAPLSSFGFDGIIGVRDSAAAQTNIKLWGVDFNQTPAEHKLTKIKFSLAKSPIEFMHSTKVLPNGRVFIAANTSRDSESETGVVYELLEIDQSFCIPIKSAQTGRVSVICL